MRIYTKTGDKGTTSLVGGVRVSKSDARLEAYGTSDELNSYLGWLRARSDLPEQFQPMLELLQQKLFTIGAALASDGNARPAEWNTIKAEEVAQLEQWIDEVGADLPQQFNFTLPGGSETLGLIHVSRTVCRRMERQIWSIDENQRPLVDTNLLQFVNRMSDFLYILSLKVAKINENAIFLWKKA